MLYQSSHVVVVVVAALCFVASTASSWVLVLVGCGLPQRLGLVHATAWFRIRCARVREALHTCKAIISSTLPSRQALQGKHCCAAAFSCTRS
jgi:hypothetical protein